MSWVRRHSCGPYSYYQRATQPTAHHMHDLVRKHMTCAGKDRCHCVMDQSQVAFTVSASSTIITLEKYKTATRLRWSSCQRSEIYLPGVRIRAWRAPVSVSELSEYLFHKAGPLVSSISFDFHSVVLSYGLDAHWTLQAKTSTASIYQIAEGGVECLPFNPSTNPES